MAREYFSELNALLYQSVPTNYFRMRLASAALQLNPTPEVLESRNEISIGVLKAEWFMPGDDEMRREFVALEVIVLLHHAAETLLRMYIAHIKKPSCPWLEVTGLTDYRKFKALLSDIVERPSVNLTDEDLATVFLGGSDPEDAGLDIDQSAWDEHIEAARTLLYILSSRLLNESNLYNTAKHGLAGVVENGTKMTMDFGDGERFTLNNGPVIAYPTRSRVEKSENAASPSGGAKSTGVELKWGMSVDSISIDTDILTIELVCKFLDSLFGVTRRRYVGAEGSVWVCGKAYTWATLLLGTLHAERRVSGIVSDFATVEKDDRGNRRLSEIGIRLTGRKIGEEVFELLDNFDGERDAPRRMKLPAQERFRRVPTGKPPLLPFSPPWSQSKLADPS